MSLSYFTLLSKMPTPLATRIFTKIFGEPVGQDKLGNRYFRRNYGSKLREKRWVIYHGEPDGSGVTPEWQGWLTHTSKLPPTQDPPVVRKWMIEHKPNASGTPQAYKPPGSSLKGHSEISDGGYDPWIPD